MCSLKFSIARVRRTFIVAVSSPCSIEKSRASTRYLRTCSNGASCLFTRATAFWISASTGGACAISADGLALQLLHALQRLRGGRLIVNSAVRYGRRSPTSSTWLISGSILNRLSTRDG